MLDVLGTRNNSVEPRGSSILTFLIADVRGYTRFTVEQGDEAAARLASRFADLCEVTIGEHNGRLIELRGDEALCVFSSARDALRGAVALQQRFGESVQLDPSLPLTVGVGLDAGDAIPVRGGYRGGALNLAARLCSIAGGGEILASETVIGLARTTPGLAYVDRGQVTLKGLPAPVGVLQVAPEGELPAELPPLQPILVAHPTNLPDDSTPFIGREGESADIAALLRESGVRLVTLTGPGGTGKTRLALQVCNMLLHDFSDGVFFCDLAPLADPDLVLSAIAEVLTISQQAGSSLVEDIVAGLQHKHLLLMLDNFEHLLDAAKTIGTLLDRCMDLHVLTTSRTPLHLSREHEYAVLPLSVPDLRHVTDVASISGYDSVALFMARARAAKSSFIVTDEYAPAVAQICARLDGLPLAIELAAARIKFFPPPMLLERLSSRLNLLTGGAKDKPTRQQTLRGAIDWSYSLLTAEEQMLFARLSVFVGGCTFEAAETALNREDDPNLLDELASLVDQSLIRQEGEGEPRFSMFETIREYASDKLVERGEAARMKEAHADHYLELAERVELDGTAVVEWFRRLDNEFPNIAAATVYFLDGGQAESALRLVSPLYPYWNTRSYARQALRWLEKGLQHGKALSIPVRARALLALGGINVVSVGDFPRAIVSLTDAVSLLREIGDDMQTVRARIWLGMCATETGKYEEAETELTAALNLARETHHDLGVAVALAQLGNFARARKDFPSALKWHEEALSTGRIQANAKVLSLQLIFVADLLIFSGRLDEAEAHYEEALSRAREVAWQPVIGDAMVGLGLVAVLQNRHDLARERLREAVLLSQAPEDAGTVLLALLHMAALAAARGEANRAGLLLVAQADLRETLDFPLDPLWQGEWERTKHSVKQTLGDEGWARVQAEARSMSRERITAYAVADTS
jgi:predicted ATPase/class 3 adenylate cyclase/Tfp pilus assembly protein PilF